MPSSTPSMRSLRRRGRALLARLAGRRGRELYRRIRTIRTAPPPQVVHIVRPAEKPPRVPWPAFPPPGYLGQLKPAFQSALALEREYIELEDCYFYHTSALRDGRVMQGPWDLRGREDDYLGGISVRGKRVLELGPASGHLTFHMENKGADVVGFDAGFDISIDLMPMERSDWRSAKMEHVAIIGPVQNAWWYLHREHESAAKMVYADIYHMPGDLGEFDVSVLGAIMLHLRDPFSALEQAARRTRKTIVVTEGIDPSIEAVGHDCMRFNPTRVLSGWTTWWSFSPQCIVAMLDVLGFHRTRVTFHTQIHHPR